MFRLSLVRLTGQGRHNRGQESGAIAVIVALFVVLGVVLGLGAIVIDVGALHQERRIVQNGADAASLALAEICAKDSSAALCDNTNVTKEYLQILAGDNAREGVAVDGTYIGGDGLTDILSLCGGGSVGERFGPCPEPSDHLTSCVGSAPPLGTNYVEVRTRTQTGASSDGTLLKPFVAQAIGGGQGTPVVACARAAWGPGYPADEVVAVTDALCAWTAATSNEPPFPSLPPYIGSPPNATPRGPVPIADKYVAKVLLQGAPNSSTDPATCGKNGTSSGQYVAGNFGWLDVRDGTDCTADMDQDTGVVGGSTGGPPPGDCADYLEGKVGQTIYLPIFKSVTGVGSGTEYTIDGVAAFFLAGFQAPTAKKVVDAYNAGGNTSSTPHCIEKKKDGVDKDNGCLWGWFLKPLLGVGKFGGGTARGPSVVSVAG